MVEVEPMFRENLGDCPCGCGDYGTPRARRWSDGLDPHTRSCRCRYCTSATERPRARKRETKVAKKIGGRRDTRSGALSGVDVASMAVEIEETANVALVAGLRRWWESKQIKAKRARLWSRTHTDAEPAFLASWDDEPRLVVMEFEAFARLAKIANAELERDSE